jgi:hypothetical protein
LISNHNELLSVPIHSILLPGQNVSNHLQTSMLSAWQIVSLDYSEWIDAVGYADLDGTVWVARGDSSTWAQNNPKFRPSAVREQNLFMIAGSLLCIFSVWPSYQLI